MVGIGSGPELNLYAIMSLVSSVILLVLGGHLWGGCYLIGGLFAILAVLLTAIPQLSIVLFGGLWAIVFFLLARRDQKQSRASRQ